MLSWIATIPKLAKSSQHYKYYLLNLTIVVIKTNKIMDTTNSVIHDHPGRNDADCHLSLPTTPKHTDTVISTAIPSLTAFIIGMSKLPVVYLLIKLVQCREKECQGNCQD